MFVVSVPEKFWDEFAEYLKVTSEQMEDYYQQVGRERESESATSPESPSKEPEKDEVNFRDLVFPEHWWKRIL